MRLQTTLLLLLAVACRPDGPAPPSDTPLGPSNPPEDQWVRLGDVSLHCLDWGGTGDLLLLIPGVTGTAHIYNDIANDFTDSFRVVAMTRRGHGASDKPVEPFDLDTLADDIAGVIDHFTDQPAVLVGHSYGGIELPRVARRYAGKVEALIFLDAVYDWAGLMEMPMQPVTTYPTRHTHRTKSWPAGTGRPIRSSGHPQRRLICGARCASWRTVVSPGSCPSPVRSS